jgi:hypothetical protein
MTKPKWEEKDMVMETADHFGWDPAECRVARSTDQDDRPCLVVIHEPTGRTSDECGDAGRWHSDGTAY